MAGLREFVVLFGTEEKCIELFSNIKAWLVGTHQRADDREKFAVIGALALDHRGVFQMVAAIEAVGPLPQVAREVLGADPMGCIQARKDFSDWNALRHFAISCHPFSLIRDNVPGANGFNSFLRESQVSVALVVCCRRGSSAKQPRMMRTATIVWAARMSSSGAAITPDTVIRA